MYQSRSFGKSYPKIHFLLNLSHFVKVMGIDVKFWLVYHVNLPNMVMSRDPGWKLLNFLTLA